MSKLFKRCRLSVKSLAGGLTLVALTLAGCNNAGDTTSTQGNNPQNIATAITIDSAGVIPVFGTTPTQTVIYVHNNSTVSISGINYTLLNNRLFLKINQ